MEALVADLYKQLAKKNSFENAAAALASLFRDRYAQATPSEKKAMYAAACRAGALLQSRYTGRGFWMVGKKLFEEAEAAVTDSPEKETMRKWVFKAGEFLKEENAEDQNTSHAGPSNPFLFEGQLTVGLEPPPPAWLVAQNALALAESGQELNSEEAFNRIVQALSDHGLEEAIQATFQDATPKPPPPASREEVAKLPVIDVTEEVLKNLGDGTECAVCREVLILNDKMQEMPCKHYFHPPCLKPWLDEHNSCPICRYEMRTDDHEYESRKEREREAEADRKGAANAVRDNALMYI